MIPLRRGPRLSALLRTDARLTTSSGPIDPQPIAFVMSRTDGRWQIMRIQAACT